MFLIRLYTNVCIFHPICLQSYFLDHLSCCGYPRLLTIWIGVLLEESNCLLLVWGACSYSISWTRCELWQCNSLGVVVISSSRRPASCIATSYFQFWAINIIIPSGDSNLGQLRMGVFEDCQATTLTTQPRWLVAKLFTSRLKIQQSKIR